MSDVLILGPQQATPNLRGAIDRAGLKGPIAAVTAGWQEREGELAALEDHLGQPVVDLRLYERAEAVFARDRVLHDAYRQRQNELRQLQETYRVRLAHAKAAVRELLGMDDGSEAMKWALHAAIASLKRLDAEQLRAIERIHAQFDLKWSPSTRPALSGHRHELAQLLETARVVCIAGGHVAVLLNRLRLFALTPLLLKRTVVAWSAGAMAISDRVILFHDHPPQGPGNAELFEAGLGLVRGTVFLPHAARRLALDDPRRVMLLARRFSPARCRTLDEGSRLHWRDGRLRSAARSRCLARTGVVVGARVAS